MGAWIHLARIYHKVQRQEMAFLTQFKLTLAHFDVLMQLDFQQGITQQQLADRLLVTKGNVCGLLNRMEKEGLVERRADPEDKRVWPLFLTASGRELIDRVRPAHLEFMTRLLSGLPTADQRRLLLLLHNWEQAIAPEESSDGSCLGPEL